MTRNEFLNGITEWYELLEFCNDNGCSICDDIISDDDRDDEIDNDIEDAIRNDRWYDIKGYLEEIPTGYSYYRRNSMFDYDGMDDSDFDEYKDDVLGWADREGDIWDEDPEEMENYLITQIPSLKSVALCTRLAYSIWARRADGYAKMGTEVGQ